VEIKRLLRPARHFPISDVARGFQQVAERGALLPDSGARA